MESIVTSQTCNTCHIDKPLSDYTNNKRGKYGKDYRCKACTKINLEGRKEKLAESQRKWREKNPEYMKEYEKNNTTMQDYRKEYYKQNSDLYKERKKQWRKNNPEREKEARQKYNEKNKDKQNEYHRQWKANKRITDINYKLKENISRRIRYELNTLLKGNKTRRTTEYIGCTIEELKTHLEKQFSGGITWENYGSLWHVDHIIPCSSWKLQDAFENTCCWNFRNLQPLLASINQSKNDTHSTEVKAKYIEEMKKIF